MIKMFDQTKVIIAPDINVKDKQAKGWELDRIIEYAVEKGLKEEDTVFKDEDFSERFLEMLKEDAKNLK